MDGELGRLGLQGSFRPATDAFFLGANEGARLIQRLKGLKREYEVQSGFGPVAVASLNYHEDFFGTRFQITSQSGSAAHSLCLAFGLERLTACGLLEWGAEPQRWPAELRG